LYKAECIHMLGTPESERLKVAAPNLFRPTAFPLLQKLVFCCCGTVSRGGEILLDYVFSIMDSFVNSKLQAPNSNHQANLENWSSGHWRSFVIWCLKFGA
jgi:hypothetical protein